MYAIMEIGNKQYRVAEGKEVKIDKLQGNAGDEIVFNEIITIKKDDAVKIGAPYINGAEISAVIVRHGKAKKIEVLKYKPKKHHRVKSGHRQDFTVVKIQKIKQGSKKSSKKDEE